MFTTLDHLENYHHQKKSLRKLPNLWKEIKVFAIIFVIATVGMLVFTNAQLFLWNISESLFPNEQDHAANWDQTNIEQDSSISSIVDYSHQQLDQVEAMIAEYKDDTIYPHAISISSDAVLKKSLKNYPFQFNTLPATNRVIIPSLNLDVPLVTSQHMAMEDFTQWKFDEDLKKWIVKYPSTPNPGQEGNTLIFWHTSTELRERNKKYGTVLKDLPQLKYGDMIKIVRHGKLYTYRIIDEAIIYPKDVNKNYMKYQELWGSYLSMMGCYPIGKSAQRIIKIAKLVDENGIFVE